MGIIGDRLKQSRKRAGLTQKDVEEKLGLRDLAMKDYETERIKLPVEMAAKLAQLYKTDIDELIGRRTDKDNFQTEKLQTIRSLFDAQKINAIYLDPVIKAFVENYQERVLELTAFELLTLDQSEKVKKEYGAEVLKALATLMGTDGKVTQEELAFLNHLITSLGLDEKSRMITKSITQRYVPDYESPCFKNRPHTKHFLIWLMYFLAQSDEKIQPEEIQYIEECADKLRVSRSNYIYIKKFFVKDQF